MLERRLTSLLRTAVRRAAGERSIPWAIVVVGAYLMRRSLRQVDDIHPLTVRRGQSLTISVRDQDD